MAEGTAHEGKIRRVKRILYPLVKIIAYAGSSAEGYPKEIKIFFFLFLIDKSGFERRKLMYPLISVFIIVVGALLLVFANKIIKNNKVNRIGIKVVGGILIIVGLLLLYFLLSGKLTLPLSK